MAYLYCGSIWPDAQKTPVYQTPSVRLGCVRSKLIITAMAGPSPGPLDHPGYFRLHSVDVFVRDQERSLRFYIDQLGFQLAFDARLQSGERWVAVAPRD